VRLASLVVASHAGAAVVSNVARAQEAPSQATPPAPAAASVAAWPALPGVPQRVRFGLPEGKLVGEVMTVEEDSLLVQTNAGSSGAPAFSQRWLHVSCVKRAEVPVGRISRRRTAVKYSLFGAVSGALAGAGIGKSEAHTRAPRYVYEDPIQPRTSRYVQRNAMGIGLAGAAIGAVVGYYRPAERWQRVELPPMARSSRWAKDDSFLQRCPVKE
jgi:hypothetical protein